MLLSMTGYGDARWESEHLRVAVELRAVNNRYLKVSVRCPDAYGALEGEIEKRLRQTLRRGTVTVHLSVRRLGAPGPQRLNLAAVRGYVEQLQSLERELALPPAPLLGSVLALPGVVEDDDTAGPDAAADWPAIAPVLDAALAKLQRMRQDEGQAMERELLRQIDTLAAALAAVSDQAPQVVSAWRGRLEERVGQLLAERGLEFDPALLVREVAVFAERSDVREEIVRLGSHLDQFRAACTAAESPGRRLDFLVQEMNREVNTIGSKCNDVTLARHVVEMKSGIEQMRELIQNVE
ncbi:MAG TPA: YicC family protein [Gemmatales bacterium]|nr:YicC family protein [Gemmatales bacterium]